VLWISHVLDFVHSIFFPVEAKKKFPSLRTQTCVGHSHARASQASEKDCETVPKVKSDFGDFGNWRDKDIVSKRFSLPLVLFSIYDSLVSNCWADQCSKDWHFWEIDCQFGELVINFKTSNCFWCKQIWPKHLTFTRFFRDGQCPTRPSGVVRRGSVFTIVISRGMDGTNLSFVMQKHNCNGKRKFCKLSFHERVLRILW